MAGEEDGSGAERQAHARQLLTDPEQAADFVAQHRRRCAGDRDRHLARRLQVLAASPTGDILAIDRIKEIHARIPDTHLVMHGSSSVPQEWLEMIREYGGEHQGDLRRAGRGDPARASATACAR